MFLMWNAIQTANLFKISRESVRTYSKEFSAYLSPLATPGKNRTRMYTQSDMEVFALIVEMKGQGKLYSDIHAALMNGQRGILPDETYAIVSAEQPRYSQLQLKLEFLEGEVKEREFEIVRLNALLKRSDEQLIEARAEAKREIRALYEEIGLLKAGIKSSN